MGILLGPPPPTRVRSAKADAPLPPITAGHGQHNAWTHQRGEMKPRTWAHPTPPIKAALEARLKGKRDIRNSPSSHGAPITSFGVRPHKSKPSHHRHGSPHHIPRPLLSLGPLAHRYARHRHGLNPLKGFSDPSRLDRRSGQNLRTTFDGEVELLPTR